MFPRASEKVALLTDFMDFRQISGEGLRGIVLAHDPDFNFGEPLKGANNLLWNNGDKIILKLQENGAAGKKLADTIEAWAHNAKKVGCVRSADELYPYGDWPAIFEHLEKDIGFDSELYIERFQDALEEHHQKSSAPSRGVA